MPCWGLKDTQSKSRGSGSSALPKIIRPRRWRPLPWPRKCLQSYISTNMRLGFKTWGYATPKIDLKKLSHSFSLKLHSIQQFWKNFAYNFLTRNFSWQLHKTNWKSLKWIWAIFIDTKPLIGGIGLKKSYQRSRQYVCKLFWNLKVQNSVKHFWINKRAVGKLNWWLSRVVVSNIFVYFHPENWGRCPNLTNIFSDGLKPPTRILMASQNGRCQVKFAQRRTSGPRQEDVIWEAVCWVMIFVQRTKVSEGRNHELYTNLVMWWYS